MIIKFIIKNLKCILIGIVIIYNNRLLMFLRLFDITITEKNFDEYKKSLQNPELKIVKAYGFFVEYDKDKIIDLIFGNKNLETIDFYFCGSLNKYASKISIMLSHNMNLKILRIGVDNFSINTIHEIMNALKINNTLEELSINDNLINCDGAKDIANMLIVNTTLLKLNFGLNNIGNDGFIEIIRALETNITLIELYLEYNEILYDVVPQLMKMLEINNVITIYGIDHLVPKDFFLNRNNCRKIKSARK